MRDPAKEAHAILNASGYLFQLRVKHEIIKTRGEHGWAISGWEEAWKHPDGASGFTDLTISHLEFGTWIVIECKRQLDGHWVFPVEAGDVTGRYHVRVLELVREERGALTATWHDITTSFPCHEAEFCVIRRKKGDKVEERLLEEISQTLLDEVDDAAGRIAIEMRNEVLHFGQPIRRACIVPVVVTNARLSIATVPVDAISLVDGIIPQALAVEEVPFVRFRKNLAVPPDRIGAQYRTDHRGPSERTVFIVQAQHIVDFLQRMRGL